MFKNVTEKVQEIHSPPVRQNRLNNTVEKIDDTYKKYSKGESKSGDISNQNLDLLSESVLDELIEKRPFELLKSDRLPKGITQDRTKKDRLIDRLLNKNPDWILARHHILQIEDKEILKRAVEATLHFKPYVVISNLRKLGLDREFYEKTLQYLFDKEIDKFIYSFETLVDLAQSFEYAIKVCEREPRKFANNLDKFRLSNDYEQWPDFFLKAIVYYKPELILDTDGLLKSIFKNTELKDKYLDWLLRSSPEVFLESNEIFIVEDKEIIKKAVLRVLEEDRSRVARNLRRLDLDDEFTEKIIQTLLEKSPHDFLEWFYLLSIVPSRHQEFALALAQKIPLSFIVYLDNFELSPEFRETLLYYLLRVNEKILESSYFKLPNKELNRYLDSLAIRMINLANGNINHIQTFNYVWTVYFSTIDVLKDENTKIDLANLEFFVRTGNFQDIEGISNSTRDFLSDYDLFWWGPIFLSLWSNKLEEAKLQIKNKIETLPFSRDVLISCLEKISKEEKEIQLKSLPSLIFMIEYVNQGNIPDLHSFEPALLAILNLHSPQLRAILIRLLFETIILNKTKKDKFLEFLKNHKSSYSILAEILFVTLESEGVNLNCEIEITPKKRKKIQAESIVKRKPENRVVNFRQLISKNLFQVNSNRDLLLHTLTTLYQAPLLPQQKSQIVSIWMKQRVKLIQEIQAYRTLESIEPFSLYQREFNVPFTSFLRSKIRDSFDLKEEEINRFIHIIDTSRQPSSFTTYLGDIYRLPDNDRTALLTSYKLFIKSLLDNQFKTLRYTSSLHLNTVFKSREDLFEQWKQGATSSLEDVKVEPLTEKKINMRDFFLEKIQHGHLNVILFPRLKALLLEETEELKDTEEFERLCLQLCKASQEEIPDVITDLQNKLKQLDPACEFLNDLQGLKEHFEKPRFFDDLGSSCLITDTDDPFDLFYCGTEVSDSCQRIGGISQNNKALLGFVIDGKNRLICIKKPDGSLLGRAILRMLVDDKGNPALFLERIYPFTLKEKYNQQIIQFAKQRAKALNLPLYYTGSEQSVQVSLLSLSSKAPYEYCDAIGGPEAGSMTTGIYTITNLSLLFSPNEKS